MVQDPPDAAVELDHRRYVESGHSFFRAVHGAAKLLAPGEKLAVKVDYPTDLVYAMLSGMGLEPDVARQDDGGWRLLFRKRR